MIFDPRPLIISYNKTSGLEFRRVFDFWLCSEVFFVGSLQGCLPLDPLKQSGNGQSSEGKPSQAVCKSKPLKEKEPSSHCFKPLFSKPWNHHWSAWSFWTTADCNKTTSWSSIHRKKHWDSHADSFASPLLHTIPNLHLFFSLTGTVADLSRNVTWQKHA